MKKSKFLALALAIAVMLMGAGYAAWTDQLNITDTIKTGHLDVHFVDLEGNSELTLADYETGSVSYTQDGEGGQNDWDTATATINNVYPGGNFTIKYRLFNNSTMPVKLQSLSLSPWGDWVAAAGGELYLGEGISSGILGLKFVRTNAAGVEVSVDDYTHPWAANVLSGTLDPNDTLDIYVNFAALDNYTEDTTYNVTMTPVFEQFNQ